MKFFKEYNGFLFEFNSLGEFFRFLLGRLIGTIIGIGLLALIVFFLWWYGQKAYLELFMDVMTRDYWQGDNI